MSAIACPVCSQDLVYDKHFHGYRCPDEEGCGLHASFTKSGGGSVLWSIRVTQSKTTPMVLARTMTQIIAGLKKADAEPRPSTIKGQPEHSVTEQLALKHQLEPEDVFSIKHSSERPKELAHYYGISERDVKEIKNAEL